jgi:glycosyltransferase involved in cell wall biosynthesis
VGWNCVQQIARFHEVWVITRANNRESIEKTLAKAPLPNAHWVYYDLPRWARIWKKGKRGVHPYYYLWQIGAYFTARGLLRSLKFDLVQHVTFVNYWMASFLALLPPPFIWGPVGGGESPPRGFWRSLSFRGKVYEALRNLARGLGELDPFVRLTARRAAVAVATTEETAVRLRGLGCREVVVLSQVALPKDEIDRLGGLPIRQTGPFRLVSIGNLLHWKGFELGLRAFAKFHCRFPGEYWLIGEGPERNRLERLARQLGVADKVTFWEALPRQEVFEKLAQCDVLVHPSLHDSGGYVCSEAMAAGRPVICLNIGGPAVQVTEETGFEIPAITPEQAAHDIALALGVLAANRDLRFRLGQVGRCRVREHFSMENQGNLLANLYALVRSS